MASRVTSSEPSRITIIIPPTLDRAGIEQLRSLLASQHNDSGLPVTLSIPRGGQTTTIGTPYRLIKGEASLAPISKIVGSMAIRYQS